MDKRIKDILTSSELEQIHKLNKSIMGATSKKEIQDYKGDIDHIIEKAKNRFFVKKKSKQRFKNKITKWIVISKKISFLDQHIGLTILNLIVKKIYGNLYCYTDSPATYVHIFSNLCVNQVRKL